MQPSGGGSGDDGRRVDPVSGAVVQVVATGEAVHIHQSLQPPGTQPGAPHAIQHSEFILVTEGTLEIAHDGKTERAGPGDVIYIAHGTVHQARNAGSGPAKYTVVAIGGDAK